jgi:Fe-S-cluster containining protein
MPSDENQPWYKDGLRFECTQCGRCCRGPGNVWVSDEEIENLAQHVEQSVDEFRATYVKRAGRRGLVLTQKRNQDCIFWDETTGCQVYTSRPRQCLTYPFWRANLTNEYQWTSERRHCPGVDKGPLHSPEEIDAQLENDGIPDHRNRSGQS